MEMRVVVSPGIVVCHEILMDSNKQVEYPMGNNKSARHAQTFLFSNWA